ncbi:hypothetical protein B0H14DRAFT_2665986 [Mycena olivaceomarginata]|nr:hypothetical protein B0H14DRAFT_2665986 [Mycena olivaceomarginata]
MSKRVTKTLYTAKFYESPSSSESTRPTSSKSQQPSAYLEKLFHAHVALNQMEEVPQTPRPENTERVNTLRQRVVDAYNATNGNPASGKWGLLVNLLRTGTAKGNYRYINTRTDAVPLEPPEGWLLAETEDEWLAWERKRKREQPLLEKKQEEERLLKEKVETWKRHLGTDLDDQMPDSSPMLDEVPESPSPIQSKKPLPPSDGNKLPSKSATSSRPPNSRTRVIAEVQEALFPPSFPSNLNTSTPVTRQKPSPIELVPSSSPILSPPTKHIDLPGPSKPTTSSSSTPFSSPTKNPRVYGRPRPLESPLKRARSSSPTPNTAAKKLRTDPSPPASGSAPAASPPSKKPASKMPYTPPRNTLPKLQDLIAASAQKQKSKAKSKEKGKAKAKPALSSNPPSKSPEEARSTSRSSEELRQRGTETRIGAAVINWDATLEKMNANHTGAAAASPTKSLSSIADSNSLESPQEPNSMDMPDFSNGAPFDPIGASTQPMGMLGSESMGTTERGARGFGQPDDFGFPMRYESQLDVESHMQGVEDLLDADVGGYTGPWMGAGSDDDEQWGGNVNLDSSP